MSTQIMNPKSILNKDFLDKYGDFPEHMTPTGKFTYLRTYSRYVDGENRRETFKETVSRASMYNIGLDLAHRKKYNIPYSTEALKEEAELLFDNMFNLRQFLSGRTLWVGGAPTGVADKFPLANFNCAYTLIKDLSKDLGDLFYLLLVGTGVGFKAIPKYVNKMPSVRTNFKVITEPYNPVLPENRIDDTRIAEGKQIYYNGTEYITEDNKKAVTIYVGDSKEGWVEALRYFFTVITCTTFDWVEEIRFIYDSIRPKGEVLKTFGGTASGHEPLQEMFERFEQVIKNELDSSLEPPKKVGVNRVKLRPVHIIDMANLIGHNVVVGGVRRTSEIALFSGDEGEIDYEAMFMKFGINGVYGDEQFEYIQKVHDEAVKLGIPVPAFFEDLLVKTYTVQHGSHSKVFYNKEDAEKYAYEVGIEDYFAFPTNTTRTHLSHRRMSNNSMVFHSPDMPDKALLDYIFLMMRGEGEPGFINLYEASRRRLEPLNITDPELIQEYAYQIGLNPCAEILLDSKGVCNLTTINVTAFVTEDGELLVEELLEAQKLSARNALRMTLVDLELPEWDKVQKRDRLLGTSLTGWKDAMGAIDASKEFESYLLNILFQTAREEADRYARELRINTPLLVTTVKPEGTLSIVAGDVSSGLHVAHDFNYIRRIRITAEDPLAKAVQEHEGWTVHAEVGTEGYVQAEDLAKPEVIEKARTLVIDFPVHSTAKKVKADTDIDDQFETYFTFQREYTEHNSSNTIHVRGSKEWEKASDIIYNNWSDFVGVSFLDLDENTYTLAPFETITEDERVAMEERMQQFDDNLLQKYVEGESTIDEFMDDCIDGVCPIR